ncbi:hypothetical protein BKA70DRAFT_1236267 [Coprinopsis sp. MPI-PUGE-AT-0042]|nr:hypothetical protein BKA70DRAFT_1236267 [Coprinopsis sp. MPI-PUGE-AT-0042]
MSPATDIFNWSLAYFSCNASIAISVAACTLSRLKPAAIQLFMWCYMVSRFRAAPSCARTRRTYLLYFAASFIILSLSAAEAIVMAKSVYDMLLRIVPGEDNLSAGWDIIESVYSHMWAKAEIVLTIALWVGDAMLVYRCYVIWSAHVWVYCLPSMLWIATIAIGLASLISASRSKALYIANVFLVVTLHTLITFLISIRLIHAHRRLRTSFPLVKHTEYLGAVAILVESAAPLAIFGLGTAISGLFDTSVLAIKICYVFQTGLWASSTLAPQLIIFRVATGRSWATKSESMAILSQEFEAAVGALDSVEIKEREGIARRSASHEGSGTESRPSI